MIFYDSFYLFIVGFFELCAQSSAFVIPLVGLFVGIFLLRLVGFLFWRWSS